MTTKNHAQKEGAELSTRPDVVAGAGRLTAEAWMARNEEVDFDFTVFRVERTTGRVGQLFQLADIADLARLAQVLAAELSTQEELGREMCDDLACLAACLEDVLPSGFVYPGIRCRENGPAGRMLWRILDVLWEPQGRDFKVAPTDDHIYRQMVAVDAWLRGVGPVSGIELPSIDPSSIEDSEGGCPVCGTSDGDYGSSSGLVFVCHTHMVCWQASSALQFKFRAENPMDWPENDAMLKRYADVYPMFNPNSLTKGI